MAGCQIFDPKKSPALTRLQQFVTEVQSCPVGQLGSFADFELAVREGVLALGREMIASEMARYDVTASEIGVEGVFYHPKLRCSQTYMSSCGRVRVERQLYAPRGGAGRSICPLEERIGVVNGFWTPRAAYEGAQLVAEVPPGRAEELLRELSGMRPSKTSLDRLPKSLSSVWESRRVEFEEALRQSVAIPQEAATVGVSLDGVMAPMRDGNRQSKRSRPERQPKGPAGFREVGCATVTFYAASGDRLSTIRWARMPEAKKATLCEQIEAELTSILGQRPDLRLVKLSDGAESHWEFLVGLPKGTEVLDFYHACEHLKRALDAVYGEGSPRSRAAFEKNRVILKEDSRGVDHVIRSFVHLRSHRKGRRVLERELAYFRKNRSRMRYASYRRRKLPIGTGVTEAACKTLVTQRMKHSGMRWLQAGGQAILTLRGLIQSDRLDLGWALLSEAFKTTIYVAQPKGRVTLLQAA
jgi:hypothetical protein